MKKFILKYYPEITGIFVFITYMFTIGHSLGECDAGELAMAQATLSIPHPTGYPLFVLVGFLFSKIPLPFTTIFKLNLLSAVWCTLTLIIVIRISSLVLENFSLLLNNKGRSLTGIVEVTGLHKIIASVFSGLMLAYSATFWLQSTRVEVYSFQVFLTSVIIFFTLKTLLNKAPEKTIEGESVSAMLKKWKTVFIFLGFGFANHMMTLYLLPSTIIIFFSSSGLNKKSIKSLLLLFSLTAAISVIFYLGLMFRANMNPAWSFSDATNINSLLEHITAREYSKYMLQGLESAKEQTSTLVKMLSFNFSKDNFSTGEFSLSILFGITGLLFIFLFRKDVAAYFFFIIIVAISLALSYKIPDINEYFLVPFLIISLLSIIPIIFIAKIIVNKKLLLSAFFTLLCFMILTQFLINYNYTDRSNDYIFEDFYKESVEILPPNSILLTDKWSVFVSPGLYYREVEKVRNDVSVVSPGGIMKYAWYRKKYKNEVLYDKELIINKKNLFISLDVAVNQLRRGILNLPPNSVLIPYPYYYRVVYDNEYYPLDKKELKIRFNKHPYNDFDAYIYTLIPFMLEQRIVYELKYNQIEKALYYYNKIKDSFKDYNISNITIVTLKKYGLIEH